jgi:hypothetical protein
MTKLVDKVGRMEKDMLQWAHNTHLSTASASYAGTADTNAGPGGSSIF